MDECLPHLHINNVYLSVWTDENKSLSNSLENVVAR